MSVANAAYLVDTGPPDLSFSHLEYLNNYANRPYGELYKTFTQRRHLAASFNITDASTITSLGAYLWNDGLAGVTYELHQGGPTGSLVYSGRVDSVGTADFYTLSGLNLAVEAGLYTLNFIASYGFDGFLGGGAQGSPDALMATFYSYDASTWEANVGTTYSIQVGGTTVGGATGVPAPLPLLGVLSAFSWSRKIRSRIKHASQLT